MTQHHQSGNELRSQPQNKGSALGVSLILVVFILLCLITFGTLSYLQAKSNDALSRSSTESVLAYYTADAAAKERLQVVEDILADCYPYENDTVYDSEALYWYAQALQAAFACEDADYFYVSGEQAEDGTEVLSITFGVPVSDTEVLRVILEVHYPAEDTYCSITSWSLVSAENWYWY